MSYRHLEPAKNFRKTTHTNTLEAQLINLPKKWFLKSSLGGRNYPIPDRELKHEPQDLLLQGAPGLPEASDWAWKGAETHLHRAHYT